jgi:HEAT repeat protein
MLLQRLPLPILFAAIAVCQSQPSTEHQSADIIEKALGDKNPDVRKQAALALSLGGPREPFLSKLEAMLEDKDVEVRLATISSLADLKTKRTAAALRKALNDDVPEVSFAAAKALWSLNDPAGKEALLSVVSGETKVASGFISKQKRDAMRMMHTPKAMVMFALKQGIGFAPIPGLGEGISSMQGLLSDPGVSGRAMATLLIGKDKDEATLQAIREALTDKDWSVRAAAVHSIALRNDPALQRELTPLLEDKKEAVRLRAAAGYLRLQMIKRKPRPAPSKQASGKD